MVCREESCLSLNDIELGDEIGPLVTEATDDGVASFCEVWGTPTPNRFTDRETAEKAKLPGPIVPRNYVNGDHGQAS